MIQFSGPDVVNMNKNDRSVDSDVNHLISNYDGSYTGIGDSREVTEFAYGENKSISRTDLDSGETFNNYIQVPPKWNTYAVDSVIYDTYETAQWVSNSAFSGTASPWYYVENDTYSICYGTYSTTGGYVMTSFNISNDMVTPEMFAAYRQDVYIARWHPTNVWVNFTYYANHTASDYLPGFYIYVKVGNVYERDYFVFSTNDNLNQWISGSFMLPSDSISNLLLPGVVPIEVGIGTTYNTYILDTYDVAVRWDNVQLSMRAEAIPNDLGIKMNATSVPAPSTNSNTTYIVSDSRDAYSLGSTIDVDGSSSALYFGYDSSSNKEEAGLQFALPIPQGALITNAYLTLKAAATAGASFTAKIYVGATTNPAAFSASSSSSISDMYTFWYYSVDWTVSSWSVGSTYQSPDISKLIQRVVSNRTWTSGSYVLIKIDPGNAGSNNYRAFYDSSSGTSNAANLTVQWKTLESSTVTFTGNIPNDSNNWKNVCVNFTSTNSNIDFMNDLKAYVNRTSSTTTQSGASGVEFSVSNDSSVEWTAYFYAATPSGYSLYNFSVSKPTDWVATHVYNPLNVDKLSSCTGGTSSDDYVGVPNSIAQTYGTWKLVFTQTNRVTNVSLYDYTNSRYVSWINFTAGDSTKVRAQFTSAADGTIAHLNIYAPDGSIWYCEEKAISSNLVEFSKVTFAGSNSSAGKWTVEVYWNNSNAGTLYQAGEFTRHFGVLHTMDMAMILPSDASSDWATEAISGDLILVKVRLDDQQSGEHIAGATVTCNWTDGGSPTTITFNDLGTGEYTASLNTTQLGGIGTYKVNITGVKDYLGKIQKWLTINVSAATTLTSDNYPSVSVEWNFNTTLEIVYQTTGGTGITGASISCDWPANSYHITEGGTAGHYLIELNTSVYTLGNHPIHISAEKTFYQKQNISITVIITERATTLTYSPPDTVPVGDNLVVVLTYQGVTDGKYIDTATISANNGTLVSSTPLGSGQYRVVIDGSSFNVGYVWINLSASYSGEPYYQNRSIVIRFTIRNISTTIDSDQYPQVTTPYDVDVNITLTYVDVDHSTNIAGGTVKSNGTITWHDQGNGDYSVRIDVSGYGIGTHYVQFTITKNNYDVATIIIRVVIRRYNTLLSYDPVPSTPIDENVIIYVHYIVSDVESGHNGEGINNATITCNVSSYTVVGLGNGDYKIIIDSSVFTTTGDYGIQVTATPTSISPDIYQSASFDSLSVTIRKLTMTVEYQPLSAIPHGENVSLWVQYVVSDAASSQDGTAIGGAQSGISVNYTYYTVYVESNNWYRIEINASHFDELKVYYITVTIDGSAAGLTKYSSATRNSIPVQIRRIQTSLTYDAIPSVPIGENVTIHVYYKVSDTASSQNGDGLSFDKSQIVCNYSVYQVIVVGNGEFIIKINASEFTYGYFAVQIDASTTGLSNDYYESQTVITGKFEVRKLYTVVVNQPVSDVPYGDDAIIYVTWEVRDSASSEDGSLISGGSVETNATSSYTETSSGHYKITIDSSVFTSVGTWYIDITLYKSGSHYENGTLNGLRIIVRVIYTSVDSPDYPQVVTPYGVNVQISLTYHDEDHSTVISGGSVVSNASLDSQTDNGDGTYTVVIDVSSYGIGTHVFYFNVSKSNYDTATIVIRIVIRRYLTTLTYDQINAVPSGDDLVITLHYTVSDSESGHDGEYIIGATIITNYSQSDYTFSWDSTNHVYILTIYGSAISSVGVHWIIINATTAGSASDIYANATTNAISFTVRAISTTTTSPDYPRVVVPYGNNVNVSVTYKDLDHNTVISSASVSANVSIQWTDNGDGTYSIRILSNSYNLGTYHVNITLTKANHDSSSIVIDVQVRRYYTSLTYDAISETPYDENVTIIIHYVVDDAESGHDGEGITGLASNVWCNYTFTAYELGNGDYKIVISKSDLTSLGRYYVTIEINSTGTSPDIYTAQTLTSVPFTIRRIYTSLTYEGVGTIPTGEDVVITIHYTVLDSASSHNGEGLTGLSSHIWCNYSSYTVTEVGSGTYRITISASEVSTIGTYGVLIEANTTGTTNDVYQAQQLDSVSFEIRRLHTVLTYDPIQNTPWGENVTIRVRYKVVDSSSSHDGEYINIPTSGITTNASVYTVIQVSTGIFDIEINASVFDSIGTYHIFVQATSSGSGNDIYDTATIEYALVNIRRIETRLIYSSIPSIPWDQDVSITVLFKVDDSASAHDGEGLAGYASYFASNFTIKSVTDKVNGYYEVVLSKSGFASIGSYVVLIQVDAESASPSVYANSEITVSVSIRERYSRLDYDPPASTPYLDNVTFTVYFIDDDNGTYVDATTWKLNDSLVEGVDYWIIRQSRGVFVVKINTTNLSYGSCYVELNFTRANYAWASRNVSFTIRLIYTDAIPSVSSLSIPMGESMSFTVDFTDRDHDTPISGATVIANWTYFHSSGEANYTYSYNSVTGKYTITIYTESDDPLGTWEVVFNFTKSNYVNGTFSIKVTIRTHSTSFSLDTAAIPTSYSSSFKVNVSYYDEDLSAGIGNSSGYVMMYAKNASGNILFTVGANSDLGTGHYTFVIPADQWHVIGKFSVVLYVNWTGPTPKYYNLTLNITLTVRGSATSLSISEGAQPAQYYENISFVIYYEDSDNNTGITNSSAYGANVHIYIQCLTESVDVSLIDIIEINPTTDPGLYRIQFNTSILSKFGYFEFRVWANWTRGAMPLYENQTLVIGIRVTSRQTSVSYVPPYTTAYAEIAAFNFSYHDVLKDNAYIGNSSSMHIQLNGIDPQYYNITYFSSDKVFRITINTTVFGVGDFTMYLNITWTGVPYYYNQTSVSVPITVRYRNSYLDSQATEPVRYSDNITLVFTYTDLDDMVDISGSNLSISCTGQNLEGYYTIYDNGDGTYNVVLDTDAFTEPGTYTIHAVMIYNGNRYLSNATRDVQIRVLYRFSVATADPSGQLPYGLTFTIYLHFYDGDTTNAITNSSGHVGFYITSPANLNYSIAWWYSDIYNLTIYDSDLPLGSTTMNITFTYDHISPFYSSANAVFTITIRARTSDFGVSDSPLPTSYLELLNFSVTYIDLDTSEGISGATISLIGIGTSETLTENVNYWIHYAGNGVYEISINTTALGAPGDYNVNVTASWSGAPYYASRHVIVVTTVSQRDSSLLFGISPVDTQYLDNVTFTVRFLDGITHEPIDIATSNFEIRVGPSQRLLASNEFTIVKSDGYYTIQINTTVLSSNLVSDYMINVTAVWPSGDAPYYFSDWIATTISTKGRNSELKFENVAGTPIGDNITIVFRVTDAERGTGISNANITLICLNRTVQYWLSVNNGTYTILVNTSDFNELGIYHFKINITWDEGVPPFYSSYYNNPVQGTVKGISTRLSADAANPGNVPYSDNTTITVHFLDIDHNLRGVTGATISINYTGPWTFYSLGGGDYLIRINTTQITTNGLTKIVITASRQFYENQSVMVAFNVRDIYTLLSWEIKSDLIAGDNVTVILTYKDLDHTGVYLGTADLTCDWTNTTGKPYTIINYGNGTYKLTLVTASLGVQVITVHVIAKLAHYADGTAGFDIALKNVPTSLTPYKDVLRVIWGEQVQIGVIFNDTYHNVFVSSANVTFTWNGTLRQMSEISAGNYSYIVDTTESPFGTYVLSVSAQLTNYETSVVIITLIVDRVPTELIEVENHYSITVTTVGSFDLIFLYNDTHNGIPIGSATLSYSWENAQGTIPSNGTNGFYAISLTALGVPVGTYTLIVTATRDNYESANAYIAVTVIVTPTQIILENNPQTVNYRDVANFTVQFLTMDGIPITGAQVSYTTVGISGNLTEIGNGWYQLYFNTSAISVGSFSVTIVAKAEGFKTSFDNYVLQITPISTTLSGFESSVSQIYGDVVIVDFNFSESSTGRAIVGAIATYEGAAGSGNLIEIDNGIYRMILNTTAVTPGQYKVSLQFRKLNFQTQRVTIDLIVNPVPTEARGPTVFVTPIGDSMQIHIQFWDTHNDVVIRGATIAGSWKYGPVSFDEDPNAPGNYTFTVEGNIPIGSYEMRLSLYKENYSLVETTLTIVVRPIHTQITSEMPVLNLISLQSTSITIRYMDIDHNIPIIGANISDFQAVEFVSNEIVTDQFTDLHITELGNGYYNISFKVPEVTQDVMTYSLNITFYKENYDAASIVFTINVKSPTSDTMRTIIMTGGIIVAAFIVLFGIVYVKVLNVPKKIRVINTLVKSLSKNKIPKAPSGVPQRNEIISGLWNDLLEPFEIQKDASQIPMESVPVDVPELGELLIKLVELTGITPEELEDFQAEIAKMRPSERINFVKEVIRQEAVRKAKAAGKDLDEFLQELEERTARKISREHGTLPSTTTKPKEEPEEIIPVELEKEPEEAPEKIEYIPEHETEKLTEFELQNLRKELEEMGIEPGELDIIMTQARNLSRDLVDELIKTLKERMKKDE